MLETNICLDLSCTEIFKNILDKKFTLKQPLSIVWLLFKDSNLKPVTEEGGIAVKSKMEEVTIFNASQTKSMIQLASSTNNKNGKLN